MPTKYQPLEFVSSAILYHYVGWGEELVYEGKRIRNCVCILPYLVQIHPIFPVLPFCNLRHSFLDVLVHVFITNKYYNKLTTLQGKTSWIHAHIEDHCHVKLHKVCQATWTYYSGFQLCENKGFFKNVIWIRTKLLCCLFCHLFKVICPYTKSMTPLHMRKHTRSVFST